MEDPSTILTARNNSFSDIVRLAQLSLPARQSSLSDCCPSADSLVILDELLDDIRRSRTTSQASTPTQLSSDCENESVFQCDEGRRSEAELRGMSEWSGEGWGYS